ncbi:MAG: riboflavin synthase [Chitinophagaceae bacterium]|nr:riboflavin synthase [Chitinophagaceae bacterium]
MFTGIIESTGQIVSTKTIGTNRSFIFQSALAHEFSVDQSVSHNGVCLTVERTMEGQYQVTAVQETLSKTTLENWTIGDQINLETCVRANGRLDGHLVQGHVDTTATCVKKMEMDGSWEFRFQFAAQFSHLIIEKGSICVDGISLTVVDLTLDEFSVAIIPYTYHHTNLHLIKVGMEVNLEFDVIGKYLARHLELLTKK